MQAHDVSLKFLGQVGELEVPFFQRNYVWDKTNWEELLQSLEEKQLPFLGSIILKTSVDSEGNNYHIIVDGQQRLTTITLLVKAIFDILPSDCRKPGDGTRSIVEGNLFYRKNATDPFSKSRIKIKHSRVDQEDYANIIKAGLFEGHPAIDWRDIPDKSSLIVRCYRYYCEVLSGKSVDELNDLLNQMFNDQRRVFVRILLQENDSNEQKIFDTINRAGERLTAADIIKNNLFRICLEKRVEVGETENDVCHLYDDNWASVFSPDQEVQALWDIKRVFGNVQRTNLEFLLYCYAIIKWGSRKDIFSNLEAVYNDNLEELSYGQLKAVVKEIHSYAQIYKEKIIDFQNKLQIAEETPFFRHTSIVDHLLLILEVFGVQMFYPYVLKRLMDCQGNYNTPELKRDYGILESFIIRRRLSGKGVTDYSSKCNQILHDEGDHQGNRIVEVLVPEMNNRISGLADNDIADDLKKPNKDTAKILLFCIELYLRDIHSVDPNVLTYTYTLEHILPQKWKSKWMDVPITDENGIVVEGTDEEKWTCRERAIKSLGNMLLLTRKINTTISNGSFVDKIEHEMGYKECSKLKTTEEALYLYNHGDQVWDEKHIYDREKKLAEQILKIWPNYSELVGKPVEEEMVQEEQMVEVASPTVDDFSAAAFEDPLQLIAEMANLQGEGDGSVLWEPSETLQTDQELMEFWSYITTMKMDHSYKPVLLKTFLANANEFGVAPFGEVVDAFFDYYAQRRINNMVVEQSDSVTCKQDCSKDEVRALILRYPYDRYYRRGIMLLNSEDNTLHFNKSIWGKLSEHDFELIKRICDNKITQYYDRLTELEL